MDLEKAYQLIAQKIVFWMQQLVKMLPNIALAALILVGGIFLSRLIRNFARRILTRVIHHRVILNLFTSFIYIFAIGVSIFAALSVLRLDKAVTSLLAGAGIAGLALAFAFQDIAANFVAGIVMSFTRPINIGDWVRVSDHTGRVQDIRLRDTIIRSFDGQMVIIPNKDIFQNPIENYTMLGRRRMQLDVGVSYAEDLDKVRDLTMPLMENLSTRCPDEPVKFYYETFADSSINFSVRVWINSPEPSVLLQSKSEAIMLIKAAFDREGITIPFPIRTIDLGIKGGEKLSDMPFFSKTKDS